MVKIGIQGHPTRGKEVIQILESLGGKNDGYYGNNPELCYEIHGNLIVAMFTKNDNYKYYTLEEFEKEFPFKIGDLCVYHSDVCKDDIIVKILGITTEYGDIMYEVGHKDITKSHSYIYRKRDALKPYKEMKEERNITLTLDKAKEWYQKGGDLKQVALQAYSEEELNPLPRTWEEFCKNYPLKTSEAVICTESTIVTCDCSEIRDPDCDREVCPSIKSAEAHLALIQLEQLRDCWRQGWEPIWDCSEKWCIGL